MTASSIRVWDLPLRLFHWALALCVTGALATALLGGFWMDYHIWFGQAVFGLLCFRLAWGFLGSRTSRFASFVRGPRAILAYLRGARPAPGHNPLGGWSVMAMLVVLGVQAGTGLFADDGIFTRGPLAHTVSGATSDFLTGWHLRLEPVIYALLVLHLAAVAAYALIWRRPLVRAMVTGRQAADAQAPDVPETRDDAGLRWRALVLALVCAGISTAIALRGGSGGF